MKKILFYLSFPFLIIACSSDSDLSARRSEIAPPRTSMAPPPPPPRLEESEEIDFGETNIPMGRNGPIKNSTYDRKIIRTIHARFQTEDLNSTTTYLEGLTKEYNGLIINMNHTNSKHEFNNRIHLSIPSEKLEAFLGNLKPRSIHTDYMRVNAEDVTEEFVDISSRLKTKKEVRDRYTSILRNRAETVKDILDAEEKIRVIQEEIESIQGRIIYLKNRSTMSQVHLDLYQKVPVVKKTKVIENTFFSKIKSSFLIGWSLIQNLIIGLIAIWPLLLTIGVVLTLRRSIFRYIRRFRD